MNNAQPWPAATSIPLPGSPLAAYEAKVSAEVAAGLIPATCPHPAAVRRLVLPSRALCCEDCYPETHEALRSQAHVCAVCGAREVAGWSAWMAGSVTAVAMLCRRCQTTGNVAQSAN